MTRCCDFS